MTEYGYDIGDAKVYTDKELTLEFDASHLTREDWERILGGIPIVRCKDCIHEEDCLRMIGERAANVWHEIDYCSRGERRNDE